MPGVASCSVTRAKYFTTAADVANWTYMLAAQALFFNFGVIVRHMLRRVAAIVVVMTGLLLFILLQMTTPATIGPLGILVVFILLYVSVLGVLTFLLFGISKVVNKVSSSFIVKPPFSLLTLRRSYYFSSVIALAPVILLGMQSVGEVGVYDVLLVILFVAIACMYISKRTS